METVQGSFPAKAPQWFNAFLVTVLASALSGVFSFFYAREQVGGQMAALETRITVIEERLTSQQALQLLRYTTLQEGQKRIEASLAAMRIE